MSAAWEVVIGLEIHTQLATNSKIFSGASTAYGAEPNTQACLIDLGYPGVLPVLNEEVVRMACKFGLAVNATVAPRSIFARKNYFYPDLPKGYQISQYELPIVEHGELFITDDEGNEKRIGITRAHLEEDAGKSVHDAFDRHSGIDLNRAGTPLLEIVSEPDLRSAKEAVAYMRKIHTIVRYLGISDGNMQEGSFRCDANVSIRPRGEDAFGTRTEIKNLNSFRFVERAINFEIDRQIDVLEDGGEVVQETRLYDSARDETRSMRSKEEANDYRYFPDPDLLPVEISAEFVDRVRGTLPELPDAKRHRFIDEYGIRQDDAAILVVSKATADYFELAAAAADAPAQVVANWVIGDLSGALNKEGLEIEASRIPAQGPRGADQPHSRQHDLRQDRQGSVRGHVGRRGRCRCRDRGARTQADNGHVGDRGDRGQGDRRQPRPGRGIPGGQGEADRLLRRPGHERDRRQGQSRPGERDPEKQAGQALVKRC